MQDFCMNGARRTSFEVVKMDIVMFYLIGEKMGFGISYWLIYSLFLIIKFFKWCVAKAVDND